MSTVNNPFPYFPDAGTNGYIYIGSANQDAQTNPITVYRDEALTIPWAQPIRTLNGYPAYQGAPSGIYAAVTTWSITVKDNNQRQVMRNANSVSFVNYSELASTAAGKGASLVGNENGGTLQDLANKSKRRITLGGLGVSDGDDATSVIQAMFVDAKDGDHIVFDRDVTYTASTGVNLTVSNVTIECDEKGKVTCPNIDNSTNQFFIRIAGTQLTNLTIPSGDLNEGKWDITVSDASTVSVGDLICIKTSVYFNGISGVSGWDLINQQEWLRVRSVVGNNIRFTNPLLFTTPFASIVAVELWRPVRNTRIINPKLYGPGLGGSTITNGNGARAITMRGVCDLISEGGYASGWPGYVMQITRFENVRINDLTMDSGEALTQTQAFYGISHEGGRGGYVTNCTGRNIRRVADTGGGATVVSDGLLAQEIEHINIRGEMTNGSACGTHHCYGYRARNITAIAAQVFGVTVRSKINDIDGVYAIDCIGPAIGTGPGSDYSDINATVGQTSIRNVYCAGSANSQNRQTGVRIYANGRYNIEGTFLDHTVQGIFSSAEYIDGFRFRGRMMGSATTPPSNNIIFTRMKRLNNIDIQDSDFGGAISADIRIDGTSDQASPAENITISNNTCRSSVTNQIVMNATPGFIKGETVRIIGNIGTAGSTTNPLSIQNPTYWTALPNAMDNRKVYAGSTAFAQYTRGDSAPVCVGRYSATSSIPDGTTILDGDWIEITNPAAGAYAEQQAIFAGTIGTLAGVTGNMTSGSNVLTMTGNTATKVSLGSIITVTGAGPTVFRVKEISADYATATLDVNASSTVSGAAVGYRNPTWKGRNQIQP